MLIPFIVNLLPSLTSAVGSTGDWMLKAIVGGIIYFLSQIASIFLTTSQALLSWVISKDFLGISMTGPDNIVVSYGWAITRDLANVFLLLGLVVIGLGIILGIEDYQAKKSLPRLIAIALLINFTPVICGFILDFANLLMNYLLGAGSLSPGLANEVTNGISKLASSGKPLDGLAMLVIYFIFGIVAAIVNVLYALLFIARYVYLWILIIIAPIAFASKVFPSTGQIQQFFPSFFSWNEWWKSFIQWSTIGIYAAFFIALANRLMTAMASGAMATSSPSGNLTIFGALFTYLFPLALLLVGLFAILDAGSGVPIFKSVSKKVADYGKTAAIGAATVTAGATAGAVAGAYVGAKEGYGEGTGITRGALKGVATAEGREKGRKALYKAAEGVPFVGPKPGAYESDLRKQTGEEEKRLEKLDTKDLNYLAQEKTVLTREGNIRRAAALNILAKRKELNNNNSRYLEQAEAFGLDSEEVLKHRPDMAERLDKKTEDVIAKMSPADYGKNIQLEALEDIKVIMATNLKQAEQLGEKGSAKQTKTFAETMRKNAKPINDHLEVLQRRINYGTPEEAQKAMEEQKRIKQVITLIDEEPNFQ